YRLRKITQTGPRHPQEFSLSERSAQGWCAHHSALLECPCDIPDEKLCRSGVAQLLLTDSSGRVGTASDELRSLRRSRSKAMTRLSISDRAILHTAPLTPRAQAAGTPIVTETQLETKTAAKTEAGDIMARIAFATPKNALHDMDPRATTGNK